jgi:hypothetical protein
MQKKSRKQHSWENIENKEAKRKQNVKNQNNSERGPTASKALSRMKKILAEEEERNKRR